MALTLCYDGQRFWIKRSDRQRLAKDNGQKKRNRPLQSLLRKQPALAVALALLLEFPGSPIGDDAFSAERPVCTICGHFKGEWERPFQEKKPATKPARS